MPVARSKAQDLPVTATDLLAYDEAQLVQYLKRNNADEGFDISSLVGVRRLPKSQRDGLAHKLRDAALRVELNVDDLLTRLTDLAGRQNDSPNLEPRRSPDESTESTPPPIAYQHFEVLSHDGLIEDGGRPACSTEELSHILADPTTRYTAILSWLSDDPDTETGAGEIKTVFSRQFTRWWNFRKSQWSNRGLDGGEEGLSAFLKAIRRRYKRMGLHTMVSATSFNETIQRQWQHMPASRQLPDGQSFAAYKDAVQTRLTPHHFIRRPQLRKNPHQQDTWTNWLEYLNFEKWCLESLTTTAESLQQQFLESWKLLIAREPDGNMASSRPAGPSSTQPRRRPGAKAASPTKELEAAQAERDASNKAIRDFIREAKPYERALAAVFYQRHRVEWVIREARLMETEISQQRKTAKSKTKDDNAKESKKRRRDDEEEIPPESQLKRAKGRVGSEDAASGATRDGPYT
ncbi:hypothetical protein F4678DRAFT_458185 [Xylaria arbuscula]|nr:hypothetical protein F4678DRAFT_458185 [Xylaria arbuscula]